MQRTRTDRIEKDPSFSLTMQRRFGLFLSLYRNSPLSHPLWHESSIDQRDNTKIIVNYLQLIRIFRLHSQTTSSTRLNQFNWRIPHSPIKRRELIDRSKHRRETRLIKSASVFGIITYLPAVLSLIIPHITLYASSFITIDRSASNALLMTTIRNSTLSARPISQSGDRNI